MSENNVTKRVLSEELEKILYKEQKVLDKGFIRVIDYMGNDSSVVQAARVSYGAGTKKVSEDKGLINYLMRNHHTTPFEMCEIKFHIKLPIFVARQWIRHRTANVNEMSGRYSILSNEFYFPDKENISIQSKSNKQGREIDALSIDRANKILDILRSDVDNCYKHYLDLINEDDQGNILNENVDGISRELARINLPINLYTQFYWKIDLHNLLHFLRLRSDLHAQYEIRVYAILILEIIKKWVPYTYDAFMEYVVNSHTFSNSQMQVIKKIIDGKNISKESSGLKPREWNDLCNTIGYNKPRLS